MVGECGLLLYAFNTGLTILDQFTECFNFKFMYFILFLIVLIKLSTDDAWPNANIKIIFALYLSGNFWKDAFLNSDPWSGYIVLSIYQECLIFYQML